MEAKHEVIQQPLADPVAGKPGLADVEGHLTAALAAGTASGLQAAIRIAVRAIAAADPRTTDLSKVGSRF